MDLCFALECESFRGELFIHVAEHMPTSKSTKISPFQFHALNRYESP